MRLFELITPAALHDALIDEVTPTKRLDELKPLIAIAHQVLQHGGAVLGWREAMVIVIEAIDLAIEKSTKAKS